MYHLYPAKLHKIFENIKGRNKKFGYLLIWLFGLKPNITTLKTGY